MRHHAVNGSANFSASYRIDQNSIDLMIFIYISQIYVWFSIDRANKTMENILPNLMICGIKSDNYIDSGAIMANPLKEGDAKPRI